MRSPVPLGELKNARKMPPAQAGAPEAFLPAKRQPTTAAALPPQED
jgi:hypothetical protein